MNIPRSNPHDPHVQLLVDLCQAMQAFVVTTSAAQSAMAPARVPASNDDHPPRGVDLRESRDLLGLADILREFGLKQPQVVKLRDRWGFPPPARLHGRLVFSRTEVESWARSQPNPNNLAIVLRCRKRRSG